MKKITTYRHSAGNSDSFFDGGGFGHHPEPQGWRKDSSHHPIQVGGREARDDWPPVDAPCLVTIRASPFCRCSRTLSTGRNGDARIVTKHELDGGIQLGASHPVLLCHQLG